MTLVFIALQLLIYFAWWLHVGSIITLISTMFAC